MSATNTHTPGPWHVGHDSTGTLLIVAGDGENFDGGPWVYDSDKPEARPISEADARLIAAAPALLAALEDAALIMHAMDLPTWVCNKCGAEWSAMMNEADVPETCTCGGAVTDARPVLVAMRAALRLARGA